MLGDHCNMLQSETPAHKLNRLWDNIIEVAAPPHDRYGTGYGDELDFEYAEDNTADKTQTRFLHYIPPDHLVRPMSQLQLQGLGFGPGTLPTLPSIEHSTDRHSPDSTVAETVPLTGPGQPAKLVRSGGRAKFSAVEIESLARVVVDVNPYGAKRGLKGATWKIVADKLWARGHFSGSSTETIKNKMKGLLAYQEVCCI